jgi:hypothetical protein
MVLHVNPNVCGVRCGDEAGAVGLNPPAHGGHDQLTIGAMSQQRFIFRLPVYTIVSRRDGCCLIASREAGT